MKTTTIEKLVADAIQPGRKIVSRPAPQHDFELKQFRFDCTHFTVSCADRTATTRKDAWLDMALARIA